MKKKMTYLASIAPLTFAVYVGIERFAPPWCWLFLQC